MKETLERFFQYYLRERDVEKTLTMVTEDICSIGTGEGEIAQNKEEFRALISEEISAMPDPVTYELMDYREVSLGENACRSYAKVFVRVGMEEGFLELNARLTATARRQDGEWQITSLHLSAPMQIQEEHEFFPLRYGRNSLKRMSTESGMKLVDFISEVLPGGILGTYSEKGFPLYLVNDRMLDILGFTYDELIETTHENMINLVPEEDRTAVVAAAQTQLHKTGNYEIEYRVYRKDGEIIWVKDIGKWITTEDGRLATIRVITDITDRVRREEELKIEAQRDELTGIYNRRHVISLVEDDLRDSDGSILFILDIDNFKSVNDIKGHIAGDETLRYLAFLMRQIIGSDGYVARFGGDEYLIYFPASVKREQALNLVRKLQEEFRSEMRKKNPGLNISISAGGVIGERGDDFQKLYSRADRALYSAKDHKGELVIF